MDIFSTFFNMKVYCVFSTFFNMKVYCVFSFESSHRGDSNEFTQ